MAIRPYQGGAAVISGQSQPTKLSSNENPRGSGEKAVAAFRAASASLHRYPTSHMPLRNAIAKTHGLDVDKIICGAGSDEVITFLCQAYAGPGDEVIHTEHGFLMYRISCLAAGAMPVEVPEHKRVVDVEAILAACTDHTRLIFVANPANPTGTMISDADVEKLAKGKPHQTILVLDGAYAEYVDGFDGGVRAVQAFENVVMTRTFSKIYGLGGLRIGWGYGPKEIIDVLDRVRGPFNLSQCQLDTAQAAVFDQGYVDQCRVENARLRDWLRKELAGLGVPSDQSFANFVLPRFANQTEAEACDVHLQKQGLIVRRVNGYKLPNCLRITVGDEQSCRRVIDAIASFKETTR